jgi:hypothetical protein
MDLQNPSGGSEDILVECLLLLDLQTLIDCIFVCRSWMKLIDPSSIQKVHLAVLQKELDQISSVKENLATKSVRLSDLLWKQQCKNLWRDKVFIPQFALDLLESNSKGALKFSMEDSDRVRPTLEEFHSMSWWFGFRPFLHRMNQLAELDQDHSIWQEEEGKSPMSAFGMNQEWQFSANGELHLKNGVSLEDLSWFLQVHLLRLEWRLIGSAFGHTCVQVNNFPLLVIHRFKKNWGWVIENQAAMYTSFLLTGNNQCQKTITNELVLNHWNLMMQAEDDEDEDDD